MSKRPAEEYLANPNHIHRQRLNSTPPTGFQPTSNTSAPLPTLSLPNVSNTPPPGGLSPHGAVSTVQHHGAILDGSYYVSPQQSLPHGHQVSGYQKAALPTQQRPSPTPSEQQSPSASPATGPTSLPIQDGFDAGGRKAKQVTPTTDPTIYSDAVRKGISSHSRTGQACDRCKVRKIRCDQAPDQCTNCRNQNLDCLVTDRITGRTVRRDYLSELEKRMASLEAWNKGLMQLLKRYSGIEAKPFEYNPVKEKLPVGQTVDNQGNIVPDPDWEVGGWTEKCGVYVRGNLPEPPASRRPAAPSSGSETSHSVTPNSNSRSYRSFRLASDLEVVRRPGLHLGIMPDFTKNRSSVVGCHLAVLGFAFNLVDVNDPDVAEPDRVPDMNAPPVYNKSLRSTLRSIYHLHPRPEVAIPIFDITSKYCQWYFIMVHPFLPIIHKPTFLSLVKKFQEPGFMPTAAQTVQVHMVLAIIYYQIGSRNWEKSSERHTFNDLSNKHYHVALSKISELQMQPTFESVQAMTLISSHSRSFPTPAASLHVAHETFRMALDLNMHRDPQKEKSPNLTTELRKRVWWAILCIEITLLGKLGKPMPISTAEFDCSFPEPIPDECLLEDGVDMSLQKEPCQYLLGLACYRIAPLYLELYYHLYSAKFDASKYPEVIEVLEAKLESWKNWLPNEIRVGVPGPAEEGGKVLATYAHLFGLEFHLCLRHPAVCETSSEEMKTANITICRKVCRSIYQYTKRLMDLKSLDTTFYQVSIYVLCLMTVLSAVHKQRHTLLPQEHAEFREEVEGWLSILREVWRLIGASDASLQPFLHLVESGLDNSPPTAPMDQAALFRHVLKDVLEMRKEPKKTPMTTKAPEPVDPNQPDQMEHPSAVPVSYQNDGGMPHNSGSFDAAVHEGTGIVGLPMGQVSAEGFPVGTISGESSWFPVPPGYMRVNGMIMPMENIPNDAYAVTVNPGVPGHLQSLANGNDSSMPVSHAHSSWPLLVFDKSGSSSQQAAHGGANFNPAPNGGAVYNC